MEARTHRICPYPTADEGAKSARIHIESPQTQSPSYKLAYQDETFLLRDECRPLRLQLELLKPELIQQEHNIESTIVIFGSSRIPDPESAKKNLEALQTQVNENAGDASLGSSNTFSSLKRCES